MEPSHVSLTHRPRQRPHRRPPPRLTRTRGKLALERLEAREVPTVNTWLGTSSNSFWYDDNWSDGIPTNDDVLLFNASASNDCQAFGPAIDPNWDPMSGLPADDSFNKIVIDGYQGKIELNGDVVIHELQMASGTINPVGYDQDISIVDTFTWTGGTLNDTNYANVLVMELGSAMLVAPGEGNTVTTGTFFNLIDGSITNAGAMATFTEGAVDFRNDAGIHLGYFCQAKIDLSNGTVTFSGKNPIMGNVYTIKGTATVWKSPGLPRTWETKNMGIIVAGGDLIVYPDAIAAVMGQIYNLANNPSVQLNSGNIVLFDDATLEVKHGLKAIGGAVVTESRGSIPPNVATVHRTSTIDGDFYNYGAQVVMYHKSMNRSPGWGTPNNDAYIFSSLHVTGALYWTSGTYRPAVLDGLPAGNLSDTIVCYGTISIGFLTITPTLVGSDGTAQTVALFNRNWMVIESTEDIDYAQTAELYSGVVVSNASWCALDIVNTTTKKIFLKYSPPPAQP